MHCHRCRLQLGLSLFALGCQVTLAHLHPCMDRFLKVHNCASKGQLLVMLM
jgi:hypothetical protein